ncbi:MAG: TIGR04086 family membrane protein [Eubacteriales bacterium]|nr:TIGR04086 family membrane protein [Eubacteriales bacterium]
MVMRTVKAMITGLLVIIVLLAILSFVVVYTSLPLESCDSIIFLVMILGMFVSGMASSVGMVNKGWMRGLTTGIVLLLFVVIMGLFVSGGAIFQAGLFKGFLFSILSAMAGGVAGVNIKI